MQPLLTLQHAGRSDDQLQRTDVGFSHTSPLIIFNLLFPDPPPNLLSRTLKTGFFILRISCYITALFYSCHHSCLSLTSSCLSFILSHTHFHTLFCLLVLTTGTNKFPSSAWSCNARSQSRQTQSHAN